MARDGSGVYHRPSGIDAVTNTTISSAAYNLNVQDVEADLNLPRPIVAGGTGASTAAGAMASLGGETAKQVVTNYSSTTFVAGSFYSATTATGSPIPGHAFVGICYLTDANNMVLEARDQNDTSVPGKKWVRQMVGGVWSGWSTDAAVYIADTPPPSASDSSLWWESDTGLLYIRYNDGDSSQWVIAFPMPDTTQFMTGSQAVRFDQAQTLTVAQQTQGRQNVYAAPFDAMSYSGMQVNGNMEVSQELGSTGTGNIPNGLAKYVVDGWSVYSSGPQVCSGVPQPAAGYVPPGYTQSLQLYCTTANTSPTGADFAVIQGLIEGYRVSRLAWGTANAQPITIGFWARATRLGPYSVAVRNSVANRSYATSFSMNAINTLEYKTVTIPGDVSGTWLTTNGIGLILTFAVLSGPTLQTTANTWTAGNFLAVSGQVNGLPTTSDLLVITGVVVLPGVEAPSASRAPLIMRPYDQELLTCKRYLLVAVNGLSVPAAGMAYGSTTALCSFRFPVEMRAVPTFSISSAGDFALWSANASQLTCTSIVASGSYLTTQGARIDPSVGSGLVGGNATLLYALTANARMIFDARL